MHSMRTRDDLLHEFLTLIPHWKWSTRNKCFATWNGTEWHIDEDESMIKIAFTQIFKG